MRVERAATKSAGVPNTSVLLLELETPVNTGSRRFGISTLTSLRLFSRALHADQIVAVGNNVQRRRLRVRPRGHAHRVSVC